MYSDLLRRGSRGTATLVLAVATLLCASAANAAAGAGLDEKEEWAIRCLTLEGPNRFKTIQSYEAALKKVRGLKPKLVQVIHADQASSLYYGRYVRRFDVGKNKETYKPDPLPDLELIRQLSVTIDGRPIWPFRLAVLAALPGKPVGNPEWQLTKASGYWSYHIAVFYNTKTFKRRKAAAAEYCKQLRAQGEEAYFHHGAVNSSVYIGSYPKRAIVEVQRKNQFTGVIEVKRRIVDERMLAVQTKYPHNLENGHKMYEVERDPRGREIGRTPIPTFPVIIPRNETPASGSPGG